MSPHVQHELLRHRNKSVAKTLYRQLRGEGFTHQQIIELSSNLLDQVTEDLREGSTPPQAEAR
jgi:hypothetical protein